MSWKPAGLSSSRELFRWLENQEWKHVVLSSRLQDAGIISRFGKIGGGQLWIRENENSVSGGLFLSRWGVLLPAFQTGNLCAADTAFLLKLLRRKRNSLFSIIGTDARVRYLENILGETPNDQESYRILTAENRIPDVQIPGITVHRATAADKDRLCFLERSYQIEEVIRRGTTINDTNVKRILLQTLRNQLVFYAVRDGKPVAKANTNARGINYDQIGGVYVLPELRSRGIGALVVGRLLAAVHSEGRRACLFVKESNASALRLYEKMGFLDRGPFRISYWAH